LGWSILERKFRGYRIFGSALSPAFLFISPGTRKMAQSLNSRKNGCNKVKKLDEV
jgi:hypothetical protein